MHHCIDCGQAKSDKEHLHNLELFCQDPELQAKQDTRKRNNIYMSLFFGYFLSFYTPTIIVCFKHLICVCMTVYQHTKVWANFLCLIAWDLLFQHHGSRSLFTITLLPKSRPVAIQCSIFLLKFNPQSGKVANCFHSLFLIIDISHPPSAQITACLAVSSLLYLCPKCTEHGTKTTLAPRKTQSNPAHISGQKLNTLTVMDKLAIACYQQLIWCGTLLVEDSLS